MINEISKLKNFLNIMTEIYKEHSEGRCMSRKNLLKKLKLKNQSTMSQYMSEMKDMGFIDELSRGNEKLYVLLPAGIKFLRDFEPLIPLLDVLDKSNVKEVAVFSANNVIDKLKKIGICIDDKNKRKLKFHDDYVFNGVFPIEKMITFKIFRCLDDNISFTDNFAKKIEDLTNTSVSCHRDFKDVHIEVKVETYPENLESSFRIILERVPPSISVEDILKNQMNLEDFKIEKDGSKIYLTFSSPLSVIVDVLSDYNPKLELDKGEIILSKKVGG